MRLFNWYYCSAFVLLAFFASCAAPKNTVYFRDNTKSDSLIQVMDVQNKYDPLIQSDDILAINVTSISSVTITNDPVKIFNEGGTQFSITASLGTGASGGQGLQNSGYLVDAEGFIDFPVLGKLKVAGMTIRQTKEMVAQKLQTHVKDPVVEVRILNYKVIMLGEISRPGVIVAPNHRLSIIEALAASGDIPVTGKKDNVMVIREKDGKREFARLNLNSRDIFNSPYYYLKQNDIVYVEPSKVRRQETNEFTRVFLPTFTTLLSTVLAVYGIIQLSK